MNISLKTSSKQNNNDNLIIIGIKESDFTNSISDDNSKAYIKTCLKNNQSIIHIPGADKHIIAIKAEEKDEAYKLNESLRIAGDQAQAILNSTKQTSCSIINTTSNKSLSLFVAEGMMLGGYQFLKYKKDAAKLKASLKLINITDVSLKKDAELLSASCYANAVAKDLVNEPLSFLTAVQLSKEIKRLGKENNFKVNVLNKAKIKELKMGGLLAVNLGSIEPPTFNIMEWKPKTVKNKRPIVLVGKGVVYDTGGLSLKPTPNSMDKMKSDMGGSAAVIGAMCAVSKAKLPIHVIALVPATENRPGGNAYAPGDVITMYDKTTVEVLNTDAEGRLILADALTYAKKYKPQLVFDAATLTGAAARAIGPFGAVYMGNADDKTKKAFEESGKATYERLAEFPMWNEYGDLLKSDIADLKNVGGAVGGAITAGMFLKHFTDYPWLHFDIAGPAFADQKSGYRSKNGTGYGVRLFFDYLVKVANGK